MDATLKSHNVQTVHQHKSSSLKISSSAAITESFFFLFYYYYFYFLPHETRRRAEGLCGNKAPTVTIPKSPSERECIRAWTSDLLKDTARENFL